MDSLINYLPLNTLRYGHDPEAGDDINVRVTNRTDGLNTLKATIAEHGIILPLLVVARQNGNFVLDGNRRLAALHSIHDHMVGGEFTNIPVKVIEAEDGVALEKALIVNMDRLGLHPVDQYEAMAKLPGPPGEVARRLGIETKEVERSLKIGALSPVIRDAWRKNTISAETAKVFTLAADWTAQEFIFNALKKDNRLFPTDVRRALKADVGEGLRYVNFVGVEAYQKAGGQITFDLFEECHLIHDPDIAKQAALEKLRTVAKVMVEVDGWAWASPISDIPSSQLWSREYVEPKLTKQETARTKEIEKVLSGNVEISAAQEDALQDENEMIREQATLRAYTKEQRSVLGVILSIEHTGVLRAQYGFRKPSEEQPIGEPAKARKTAKGKKQKDEVSKVLADKIAMWNARAIKQAILSDKQPTKLSALLAFIVSSQIETTEKHISYGVPDVIMNTLPQLRDMIMPSVMNGCARKEFPAEEFFAGMKIELIGSCLEEMGYTEELPQKKTDAVKIAMDLARKTKWLPPEMRAAGYDGVGGNLKGRRR